jgi:hypothetical protein
MLLVGKIMTVPSRVNVSQQRSSVAFTLPMGESNIRATPARPNRGPDLPKREG